VRRPHRPLRRQEILERLERENLFVVTLDERVWYRYHHLFAEFLRGRLGHESPELAGELHLRAAGWYEENGRLSEAIGHALSAPDHEFAARLIGRGAKQAWSRGEVPTVLRWLEALPTPKRSAAGPGSSYSTPWPWRSPAVRMTPKPSRKKQSRRLRLPGRIARFCWVSRPLLVRQVP
jgi:hypothetical protein